MKKKIDPTEVRTGRKADVLAKAFLDNLYYVQGCSLEHASKNDLYMALSYTVRDRMLASWIQGLYDFAELKPDQKVKTVSYLSAEFLPGPHLANNLLCLGLMQEAGNAMKLLGLNLEELLNQEEEPGLGNGGLGRLASCFMDSLATLSVNAIGYGLRYEFGIFDQEIKDGWQVEIADTWLRYGNPWEIRKIEWSQQVGLAGHTESYYDPHGRYTVRWIPDRFVKGIPYDTPIIGFENNHCNTMRLWKAEAMVSFDFQDFNVGDYYAAVEDKITSETITKVLYPNDYTESGKQLRLIQQYFFTSCSLKDMIRLHLLHHENLDSFHQHYAIQLNDTHPSIAVAELMRLLVDEHHMEWEKAWQITRSSFSYTNHTLLPEALERWSLPQFRSVLPRHLEIIFEINRRFLEQIRLSHPEDHDLPARLSLIDETGSRYLRMAHLACVGSRRVNGVAAMHSELLKSTVLHDFFQLEPEKFTNITNGVTPRRWLALCNPELAALISSKIGSGWIRDLKKVHRLQAHLDDAEFREQWRRVKLENKKKLAQRIRETTGVVVEADTLFDIQAKRIHEYKRQHLNVLHIISRYLQLKKKPTAEITPRTIIFSGKAAPGYFMAKLIIKLIHSVAQVINNDPDIDARLRVVFLPDFNVKNAHRIHPAADLSEQISTAGKEASGTGNMKFALNGALTIGTLDGANPEIRQEVGAENFFLFGLTAEEIQEKKAGGYRPADIYQANPLLREVIDLIRHGVFSPQEPDLFKPLVDSLLHQDEYMLFADFAAYIDCQHQVDLAYRDQERWSRMSILNTAHMGMFSSDRAIDSYCAEIWQTNGNASKREA